MYDKNANDHYQSMLEWLWREGGELNKMELREISPGNKGMFATENIKEGETILYVPRPMLMTYEDIREAPTAKYLRENKLINA